MDELRELGASPQGRRAAGIERYRGQDHRRVLAVLAYLRT